LIIFLDLSGSIALNHLLLAKEIHGDSCGRIGIGKTPQEL
jgi:hypothetical protein